MASAFASPTPATQAHGPLLTGEGKGTLPSPAERKKDFEEFMRLRDFWFDVKPSEVGVSPSADHPKIFSVIMDWPLKYQTAGLVRVMVGAVADGTSSLYISPGPRVLGGLSASRQAQNVICSAETLLEGADQVDGHPMPPPGHVYFYIRTYDHLFRVQDKLSDLMNGRGNTLQLFDAANMLMADHLDSIDAKYQPKISLKGP